MIKAVIFDLDHTLFDRHATLAALVGKLRETFDVREELEDGYIAEKWIYADDHFVYDGWNYIFAYLVEAGIFKTVPEYAEYRSFVYDSFAKVAVPFPETVPMLKKLREKGYKTGLITNGRHELQYKKLTMLGLPEYLDEIIVSGDVMTEKPDKEIFLMMADKLSLDPSEMVYVGDNPKNDILGAHKAGYKTVWMKSTGVWQYGIDPPDAEADHVEDIPEITESFN